MMAELEVILLDSVYSGEGMAGLINLIRKGHLRKNQRIVFLHTGASAALFDHHGVFSKDSELD